MFDTGSYKDWNLLQTKLIVLVATYQKKVTVGQVFYIQNLTNLHLTESKNILKGLSSSLKPLLQMVFELKLITY